MKVVKNREAEHTYN